VIADRVVVVVPAHDEQDLLPACTAALREAARRVVVPVQLVVLLDQLTHAARGADVVAGTVRVSDWAGHPVGLRQRYEAGYTDADGHRHVHGANLGLTAAAYQRIGGFAPLAVHEDVDLVDRALRSGCTVAWTGDVVVHTSSRTAGRAPGGFAQHLADLAVAR
jgi:GT2 family glycosyltransferase